MGIGNRIKEHRKAIGMSAEELAEKVGVSPATMYRYERGQQEPKMSMVRRIANALHIDPYELVEWDTVVVDDSDPDDEVWQLREELRRDPERRTLFDAARNVRKEDILTAVKILDALKGGDD